jgi:hypothetical protein
LFSEFAKQIDVHLSLKINSSDHPTTSLDLSEEINQTGKKDKRKLQADLVSSQMRPNIPNRISRLEKVFMPLIACPECGKGLKFPDDSPPRKIKCPSCAHIFLSSDAKPFVPKNPSSPKPPPPPASSAKKSSGGFEVVEDDEEEETPKKKGPPRRDEDEADSPKKKVARPRDDEDEDEDDRPKKKSGKNRDAEKDDEDEDDRPKKKKKGGKGRDDDEDDRPKKKGFSKEERQALNMPALGALLNAGTGFAMAGGMVLFILFVFLDLILAPGSSTKNLKDFQDYQDTYKIIRILTLLGGLLGMAGWAAGFVGIGMQLLGPKNKNFMIFAGGAAAVAFLHGVLMLVTALFPAFSRGAIDDFGFGIRPTSRGTSFEFWSIAWIRLVTEIKNLPDFIVVLIVSDRVQLDQIATSSYLAMLNGFFETARWVLLFLAMRVLFLAGRDKEAAKFSLKGAIFTGGGIVAVGIFAIIRAVVLLMAKPDKGSGDFETFRNVGTMMEILSMALIAAVGGFAGFYMLKIRNMIRDL